MQIPHLYLRVREIYCRYEHHLENNQALMACAVTYQLQKCLGLEESRLVMHILYDS